MVKDKGESQLPGRCMKEYRASRNSAVQSFSLPLDHTLGRRSTIQMWERTNAGEEAEEKHASLALWTGPLSSLAVHMGCSMPQRPSLGCP